MRGDGNGWVQCRCGARHWGRHGAAGLFLEHQGRVLMQLRPGWAHEGGSWSIPGGARDSDESPVCAALREAHEEAAIDSHRLQVFGGHRAKHPDWTYDTVLARAIDEPVVSAHEESVELRWVPIDSISQMDLHPGFARSLPELLLPRLAVVLDPGADDLAPVRRLEDVVGSVVDHEGAPVLLVAGTVIAEHDPRVLDSRLDWSREPVERVLLAGQQERSLDHVFVVTAGRYSAGGVLVHHPDEVPGWLT